MASTLLRLGLWLLVIVLSLYVVHETFEESPLVEYIPMNMLQNALFLGGLLLAAGVVLRILKRERRRWSRTAAPSAGPPFRRERSIAARTSAPCSTTRTSGRT